MRAAENERNTHVFRFFMGGSIIQRETNVTGADDERFGEIMLRLKYIGHKIKYRR